MRKIFLDIYRFLHCPSNMTTLETLKFDNLVLKRLPIDSEERNYVRTVNQACFSKVKPTPVKNPRTVAYSASAMSLLDLPISELKRTDFASYFSGNKLLPGSETAAHCYCGHQFGYFSGQLGDGAAMYLGEVINEKKERWEIQLKGAGKTPYSRSADGRKVLRSSIREFLCSEAMHFLGIPTSRAGACITSDSEVSRDIYYDGNPINEKCTIVLRIAPTFIRFGSFEIFKTMDPTTGKCGPSVGRTEILVLMLDYVIETFFPEINQRKYSNQIEKYKEFFKEVVLSTARLVAMWQCVGFCHGVLNTDNMSIVGITLDYGPFGFMDMYDRDHICNGSDDVGRYTFSKQPEHCRWNLLKFSEAIQKALPLSESSPILSLYDEEFERCYLSKMRNKLGLLHLDLPVDKHLIAELLNTMQITASDFTNIFRCLHLIKATGSVSEPGMLLIAKNSVLDQCYPLEVMKNKQDTSSDSAQMKTLMKMAKDDPDILDQIGRAGESVRRAMIRADKLERLKKTNAKEKEEQDSIQWSHWLEKYKLRVEKDYEASGMDLSSFNKKRHETMNDNNPRFILRNYILQSAIEKAEEGDFSEVWELLDHIENPYGQGFSFDKQKSIDSLGASPEDSTPSTSFSEEMIQKIGNLEKPPAAAFLLKVT